MASKVRTKAIQIKHKIMYKATTWMTTTIKHNAGYLGESVEKKMARIVNNKEPITDGAPLIYTDRKDGVNPAHNIRTDRFELAVDLMDKVSKSKQATRDKAIGERTFDTMNAEQQKRHLEKYPDSKYNKKDGGTEPIQGK